MRGMIKLLPAAALLLCAWLSPFSDEVGAGNRAYRNKNWAGAVEHYKKAEEHARDDRDRALLDFNMGDVEYGRGNYDRAVEYFSSSAKKGGPDMAKRSFFNMGNAHLKSGKKREAAESYAKALEIDPGYEKARKNLEYLHKQDDSKNKNDKNSGSGGSKDRNGDKNSRDQNSGADKQGKDEMTPEQAARIFESMKNRPVRKKKGDRGGRRALEKYW